MTNQNWIYETDSNNLCRYSLGNCCKTPLLCVGVNPSTATLKNLIPQFGQLQESHILIIMTDG